MGTLSEWDLLFKTKKMQMTPQKKSETVECFFFCFFCFWTCQISVADVCGRVVGI